MVDYKRQLERLVGTSNQIGLIQHSKGSKPDLNFGYSIDDVARGLVVLSRTYPEFDDKGLHNIYLNYIKNARRDDGFFHNFYEKKNVEWNWRKEEMKSLQDCYGRVIWALSEFINSKHTKVERKETEELLLSSISALTKLNYDASTSFALLGLSELYSNLGKITKIPDSVISKHAIFLSKKLKERFNQHSDNKWKWFSDEMTYCNAKIPHSILKAKKAFDWFNGENVARRSMLDEKSGGVYDAITEKGLNINQGAESLLSYLLAATKIKDHY